MENNYLFEKISLLDSNEIHELAKSNDGNQDLTYNNFKHWYFQNPHQSNSLWKVVFDNKIEGYATTNNFKYNIKSKECMVALPQNVLTSNKVRGKGLFGKLYYKTEIENLVDNKIDCFLTFTGGMSTPIFLNKFGYLRGKCPDLLVFPINILSFFGKKTYTIINDIDDIQFNDNFNFDNARIKDLDYYKWRYKQCNKDILKILCIKKDNLVIGYSILIIKSKIGFKFLTLADVISNSEDNVPIIIKSSRQYMAKKLCPFLIMFDIKNQKKSFSFKIKNRFNFLVKGKSSQQTLELSQTNFNFFIGDLDFFW